MSYIVTQPAKDKAAAMADLASELDAIDASPSRSAEDQGAVEEIDVAQRMLFNNPQGVMESIKTATENGLIEGYADIARINREEAAQREEVMRGKPTQTWGQNGMVEGRLPMSIHLMLERHPEYGPNWWKDEKAWERAMRDFPEMRTYNRRGRE